MINRVALFSLCLALSVHVGPTEAFGQQTLGALKADRILFLGNMVPETKGRALEQIEHDLGINE
jgi:hypothetical protein